MSVRRNFSRSIGGQRLGLARGFTLVELIIVIAIVAILAGAIFVAIDPARRLHEARNARRWNDVNTIVTALKQYQVDNEGDHYADLDNAAEDQYHIIGEEVLICDNSCTAVTVTSTNCVDLTNMPTDYLAIIPMDPKTGTTNHTGYYIMKDSNGALTVGACEPEGEGAGGAGTAPTIVVTR